MNKVWIVERFNGKWKPTVAERKTRSEARDACRIWHKFNPDKYRVRKYVAVNE